LRGDEDRRGEEQKDDEAEGGMETTEKEREEREGMMSIHTEMKHRQCY
jgi:hypothetical protein